MKRYSNIRIWMVGLCMLLSQPLLGQDAAVEAATETSPEIAVLKGALMLVFLLAFICLLLALTVFVLIRPALKEYLPETGPLSLNFKLPTWNKFWQSANDFVPMEEEPSIDMGHNYDGIRELDNNLPPWWKYGFYATIAIGVVYMIHFHIASIGFLSPIIGEGISSSEEYQLQMAEAAVQKEAYMKKVANMVNEETVTNLSDASSLKDGKAIYDLYCVACHGPEGQGGIGPNFADQYWIHGGAITDLFTTIKYGVPEKGMISWQTQLKPIEMQQVASYILTFQGTSPPNPKDPEGELYVPETVAQDSVEIAMVN